MSVDVVCQQCAAHSHDRKTPYLGRQLGQNGSARVVVLSISRSDICTSRGVLMAPIWRYPTRRIRGLLLRQKRVYFCVYYQFGLTAQKHGLLVDRRPLTSPVGMPLHGFHSNRKWEQISIVSPRKLALSEFLCEYRIWTFGRAGAAHTAQTSSQCSTQAMTIPYKRNIPYIRGKVVG